MILQNLKRSITLLTGMATLIICAGCQYQNKANLRDDVLVYCSEGSPETFNPQLSTTGVTFDASSRVLYNRLVEFKPGTNQLQPGLATDWEISNDGKQYTFHLRKNVHYHTTDFFSPGRAFNADDVIFSFEKQRLRKHPFHKTSNFRYHYFESMGLGKLIKRIEKITPYTIRFHLHRAESPFLSILAMDFASILSAEYAQKLLKAGIPRFIDTFPIGTGPFQLTRYQPDAYIRYKAHPKFWQGKQQVKKLVYAITPDAALRFARMVAGECDVMSSPLPVHLSAAEKFENTQVLGRSGLNVAYLSFNTLKPPFDNQQVRQALNHAINKQAIIEAVYQQTATPATTPLPPALWAHDDSVNDYEYNPVKARALLKSAGFPDGFTMQTWIMSAQRAYNPDAKKMAELIQQDLRKIGVSLEIISYEYGTFLSKVRQRLHHSALMGWISDNGDPDNFFTPLLSCNATNAGTNSSFWCDPNFDRIIKHASSELDREQRKASYAKAQKIFKQASPWVPIAHASQNIIISPRVKNFRISPSGGIYFNQVTLEPLQQQEKQHD